MPSQCSRGEILEIAPSKQADQEPVPFHESWAVSNAATPICYGQCLPETLQATPLNNPSLGSPIGGTLPYPHAHPCR